MNIVDKIREMDGGEYWVLVCEFIYLVGCRPGDALKILDKQIGGGVAAYQPSKRSNPVELTYTESPVPIQGIQRT